MRGASFGPMAAISRHGQGGRIYNNTRARVLLRRMCVKPANRTTHSPPKAFARPRTAHALPEHFFTPSSRRRTPADLITHSPPKTFARPRTATRSSRALPLPHAAPTHARRPHNPFPTEDLRPSPQRRPASPSVPLRAQKKRHRTVDVRCRMSRSTVVAVGHWGW